MEWISVEDRLPEEYKRNDIPPREYWVLIDLWWTNSKVPTSAFLKNGCWYDRNFKKINQKVKCWQPLPEPPKE